MLRETEGLLIQLLEEALFPMGEASTSGAMPSLHSVLDSLPSDRHLLSGRGERNILSLMSYGKTLAGCNRNQASVFLDFSLFHEHKVL